MPSSKTDDQLTDVVHQLFDVGGLKFGDFVMKSGRNSPVYIDLRVLVTYPKLMERVALLMWERSQSNLQFDSLCGVPYNALPLATVIAVKYELPMLIRRKEVKRYGTKKLIEGAIKAGDRCVIIEDVVTTGSSILETVQDLRHEGVDVRDTIVLVDREQGASEILARDGIRLHSLCTLMQVMHILSASGKVNPDTVDKVKLYLQENQAVPSPATGARLHMSYEARAEVAESSVAAALLRLMSEKRSNLCVAADVSSASELVSLARQVGPHICLLKTHADMVANFTSDVADELIDLARDMKFMILEDRKFGDIGHTVARQYCGGVEASRWADLVTAHALPGPGVLQGLEQGASSLPDLKRGCFLLAEMSCAGNLITPDYTKGAVAMAQGFPQLVAGLVAQSPLAPESAGLVQLTPGVHRAASEDGLAQRWVSPREAVLERGADVVVVGRGVTAAEDAAREAEIYRQLLWVAYEERVSA